MDYQRAESLDDFASAKLTTVTEEEFRWASGVVASHAVNIVPARSHAHTALIPLGDLMNTVENPHMYWDVNSLVGSVDFVAVRPVAAGEEVPNSYGQHPNVKMLQTYGFTFAEGATASFRNRGLFLYSLELTLPETQSAAEIAGVRVDIFDELPWKPKIPPVFRFAHNLAKSWTILHCSLCGSTHVSCRCLQTPNQRSNRHVAGGVPLCFPCLWHFGHSCMSGAII